MSMAGDVYKRQSLDSDIERDIYAGRLAEETGVAKDSILSQVRKKRARQEKTREQKEFREFQQQAVGLKDTVNPEKYKHLRAATAEEALIAYLLRFPEVGKEGSGKLPSNKFGTSFNSRVYEGLLGKMSGGKDINLTDLSADFSPDELSAIAKMIAAYAKDVYKRQA